MQRILKRRLIRARAPISGFEGKTLGSGHPKKSIGTFPDGIDVVTIADYWTLSSRRHSYLEARVPFILDTGEARWLHGCRWETFYILAYCGLVGNPHLTANIQIAAPLPTSTKTVAEKGGTNLGGPWMETKTFILSHQVSFSTGLAKASRPFGSGFANGFDLAARAFLGDVYHII